MQKQCAHCLLIKDETFFYAHPKTSDKLHSWCKLCFSNRRTKEDRRKEYWKNRDVAVLKAREYYAKNKKTILRKMAEHHAKNKHTKKIAADLYKAKNYQHFRSLANASNNKWMKANKHLMSQKQAKRKSTEIGATPKWRNEFLIKEIYSLAQLRTTVTGIKWNVDHIVPLKSRLVCGLHVEHNLQVIPSIVNFKKGNRMWPDMPEGQYVA